MSTGDQELQPQVETETPPQQTEGGAPPEPAAAEKVEDQEVELEVEEPDDGVPRVLVTGASGYVGMQLTKALLEDGRFRVRGTVRSKKKKEKVRI